MTKHPPPFSPEVRERAVRLARKHESEHGSQWAAIQSIAAKIGCSGETLRKWVRQAERDRGVRAGLRIPTEAGHPFRREAGQRSDLMSATIPR